MFAEKPKRGATHRTNPRRQEDSFVPSWLKLMMGTLLSVSLLVLFYLWQPWAPAEREQQQIGLHDTANEQQSVEENENYDFYKVLPQQQVTAIPQQPLPADPTIADTPPAGSADTVTNAYMLQVNSFRNPDLADDLRSQVLMAGLPADVRITQTPNGETWYRVVSGPFSNQPLAVQAQRTLQHRGIDSILVRMN